MTTHRGHKGHDWWHKLRKTLKTPLRDRTKNVFLLMNWNLWGESTNPQCTEAQACFIYLHV